MMHEMKLKTNIKDLFSGARSSHSYVKVAAPMVRYSKVQFRSLLRSHGVDLCFTPMIMADSFCQHPKARANEFTTTECDSPLIVQFAAKSVSDFVGAANLVYPYADGVDLNCGCPQRWAIQEGYGCALLNQPQVIFDLVRNVKNQSFSNFSVSVKVRLLNDMTKTITLCQQLEKCGVTFLTVHGRTPAQKSSGYVNVEALKEVCEAVQIPIVANGGVKSLQESDALYDAVKCDGVMAASGLLTNPALFAGYPVTPMKCVKQWLQLRHKNPDKIIFQCYHHHLVFMLEKVLTKDLKKQFNNLKTFESVDNFLLEELLDGDILPISDIDDDFINCVYSTELIDQHNRKCKSCSSKSCSCISVNNGYNAESCDGVFFSSFVEKSNCESDYFESAMFDEVTIS